MSYWGGAWNSLKFSAGSSGVDILSSVSYRYLKKKDGDLIYKNSRAYKSVLVHVVRQTVMQAAEAEINKLFPKYRRYLEKNLRESVLKQQDYNQVQLIRNRENQMKDWGRVNAEGNHVIIAKDKYGNFVPEAFMMYYDAKEAISVDDVIYVNGEAKKESYQTKTVCFIDLVAKISVQSSKNLILSTVQGRDYTRKELVSGGDLTFSVSGEIVSNEIDVYPENDVKKFIQIAQYGGVVKVNHFLFKQFNINQFIIKEYQLGAPDYKNIQPYSFTCVAVEPDEDVIVTSDTIAVLNRELVVSPMNQWYKVILNNKLSEIVANSSTDALSSVTNIGLDILVPNI
jgi:hypothetical protein